MTAAEPLNATTTEQLRIRAANVRDGDRLLWAAVAGDCQAPLEVEKVSPRDCHGMVSVVGVSLLGDRRIVYAHADTICEVEREAADEEPEDEDERDEALAARVRRLDRITEGRGPVED